MNKTMKKIIAPVMGAALLIPGIASASTEAAPTVNTPAAELRSTLDHLLSEHFVLAVTSMAKAYDGAADADAAAKALDQNAADMTPAIASVYGEEGAAEFERIFKEHNNYTADFVQAAKENDSNARAEAEKEVEAFVNEFSAFLSTATGGTLPATTAEEAIRLHEEQVLSVFDSYTAGDYEAAMVEFREGYQHMFAISKALSTAIVTQLPDKFEHTKADEPAAEWRSTLNSLAAEHFALAAMGMQKGVDQAADYDFVSWAEDENTADFKAAMASVYGEEGAAQFEKVWQTDHLNAQAEIVAATLEENEEAVSAAKKKLDSFATDFGAFLGTATAGNLPAEEATAAVKGHEELILQTFDQYAAGDDEAAYESFREGYAYMFGVGQALGEAIVTQMPDNFTDTAMPDEMPKTGFGGAEESMLPMIWAAMGSMLAVMTALLVRRRALQK